MSWRAIDYYHVVRRSKSTTIIDYELCEWIVCMVRKIDYALYLSSTLAHCVGSFSGHVSIYDERYQI